MAHLVVMPKLGNTVESCLIVGWKAKEGDSVSPSTPLCEIETDKATMEVPAGVEGIILKLLKAEGDDVPVMEPIAVVGARGEVWDGTVMEKKGAAAGAATGAAAGAAPAA
ncbi:MAG TPA: biotin/lipoyl-containing protein, partial [Rectinemataceae bacterium]